MLKTIRITNLIHLLLTISFNIFFISCGEGYYPETCDSTDNSISLEDFQGYYSFQTVALTYYDTANPNSLATVHPEYDPMPVCRTTMRLTKSGLVSKAYYECPFSIPYLAYSEYDIPELKPLQLKHENGAYYVKFPYFESQWWVTEFPMTWDTYIAVIYPTSYLGDFNHKDFKLMQLDVLSVMDGPETKLSDSNWIIVEKQNCKLRFETLCDSQSDCNNGYPSKIY